MKVEKTYIPKASEINQDWVVLDANGQSLGRFATQVTGILLGKNKPNYTPGMDTGDYVIVINCEKVTVTGKKTEEKIYYKHSQYPGGLSAISLRKQLERHPERVIRSAVWGMLPHNKFGRQVIKKLKAYAGSEHPHEAQKPTILTMGKE
jgi:large subunit ribosomal protein L13